MRKACRMQQSWYWCRHYRHIWRLLILSRLREAVFENMAWYVDIAFARIGIASNLVRNFGFRPVILKWFAFAWIRDRILEIGCPSLNNLWMLISKATLACRSWQSANCNWLSQILHHQSSVNKEVAISYTKADQQDLQVHCSQGHICYWSTGNMLCRITLTYHLDNVAEPAQINGNCALLKRKRHLV